MAQFTAKTTNSEKAIYFCHSSHMFFIFKSCMFSDFTWKKDEMVGELALPLPPYPSPLPFFSTALDGDTNQIKYSKRVKQ